MHRGGAKLVRDEMVDPGLPKRDGVAIALNTLHDLAPWTGRGLQPVPRQFLERVGIDLIKPTPDQGLELILQRRPARDDDPDEDGGGIF